MGYYQYPLNLECRFPRGAILAEAAATDQAAKAKATAFESCPSITLRQCHGCRTMGLL